MRALAWLLCAAALVFAAGALPSLALFALAVGMVLLLVGAAAAVLTARVRLSADRMVLEREFAEDRPLRLRFDVTLPAWLPVRVHVRVARRLWVELEEGGGVVELPVERRGAYRVEPSAVRIGDALGVFRRTVRVGSPEEVLVLPLPEGGAHAPPARGRAAEETEPDGLRPYVPGTPVSRIHWLSLARGRGLHERRLGPPPTGLPLVAVDTSGLTDPREVDWVARVAAGHVQRLSRDGGCAVLLPGDAAPAAVVDEGSWRALHRRLATLQAGGPAPAAGPDATVIRLPAGQPPGPEPLPLPPGVVPVPAGPPAAGLQGGAGGSSHDGRERRW
ncbi:DUF58 domain-containing protein [Thermomonospora cellulosilytica]|uniref:Uncharacterized protein (DUF58 family) n=1 Tax=Thermomonospora cellulosilytica TaxID=1411118 RepID=A0A7W3N4E0_9ACTN|nr:DUF58 domain-containing protein [Thermomonospora cellulosilytica]MBA9007344.1 uncharacterized protein (DUF58 family) [Thermomonospora cellulosilytica]